MTLPETECEQSRLVFKGSDGLHRQGLTLLTEVFFLINIAALAAFIFCGPVEREV